MRSASKKRNEDPGGDEALDRALFFQFFRQAPAVTRWVAVFRQPAELPGLDRLDRQATTGQVFDLLGTGQQGGVGFFDQREGLLLPALLGRDRFGRGVLRLLLCDRWLDRLFLWFVLLAVALAALVGDSAAVRVAILAEGGVRLGAGHPLKAAQKLDDIAPLVAHPAEP